MTECLGAGNHLEASSSTCWYLVWDDLKAGHSWDNVNWCFYLCPFLELPSDESSFHKFHVPKSLRPLFKKLLLLFHSSSGGAPHVTWPLEDDKQPVRQSRVTARVR